MLDPIYLRYEEELAFIRHEVRQFAERYPSAASRLLLENESSADPHVERLIESFALLTARIRTKIDDEFPELVESLIERLYPHFTRPMPTMCVIGFEIDPKRARIPGGLKIGRSSILSTPAPKGDRVLFQTGVETQIWPIRTVSARYLSAPLPHHWNLFGVAQAAIHIRLELYGGLRWHELQDLKYLRFYFNGSRETVETLQDALLADSVDWNWILPDIKTDALIAFKTETPFRSVGLEPDEFIIPKFEADLWPYRLLTEFMVFPEKFHFLDIAIPNAKDLVRADRHIDLVIGLKQSHDLLEKSISANTFLLGCIPAINLFDQTAEPINAVASKYQYRIVADVAHDLSREVYCVNSVTKTTLSEGTSEELQPFFEAVWEAPLGKNQGYWQGIRSFPNHPTRSLSDVFIRFLTPDAEPVPPDTSTLVVRTTCSNGDLPVQLAQVQGSMKFHFLSGSQPISQAVNVSRPTPSLRPPSAKSLYGKLLSQINLNNLSWTDGPTGVEAFKSILRLYIPLDPSINHESRMLMELRIDAIESIQSRPIMMRYSDSGQSTWVRGLEIRIGMRTEAFIHEGGMILWASVLERFLALNLSVNSFIQMKLVDHRGQGVIYQWPMRTGEIPAL